MLIFLLGCGGDVLGTTTMASLPGGEGHYVRFTVPADRLAAGLKATVDGEDQASECDETNNVNEYRDPVCP